MQNSHIFLQPRINLFSWSDDFAFELVVAVLRHPDPDTTYSLQGIFSLFVAVSLVIRLLRFPEKKAHFGMQQTVDGTAYRCLHFGTQFLKRLNPIPTELFQGFYGFRHANLYFDDSHVLVHISCPPLRHLLTRMLGQKKSYTTVP